MKKRVQSSYVFDEPNAIRINKARLKHLNSLKLSLHNNKVLDVGTGVGHLAPFFLKKKCDVFCIDGRKENISVLKSRLPNVEAKVIDVEKDDLSKLGNFDIVFCYGLIYHTSKPQEVLTNLSNVCSDILLLETCVLDSSKIYFESFEDTPAQNQALSGRGCRPSPGYVVEALKKAGFFYIYIPKTPPQHNDFLFEYKNTGRVENNGGPIRQIFIASRTLLKNPNLTLVSSGEELYKRDKLLNLPLPTIKLLARLLYKPLPLKPQPKGPLYGKEIAKGRSFLRRLWKVLESQNLSTEIIIKWYKNIKISLSTYSELSYAIFVEGKYEPNEFYFLESYLKKEMVFIDVGANIGLYSLFSSKLVGLEGKVIAVEPSLREYKSLRRNFMLNRNIKNTKILRISLMDKNSKMKLKIAASPHEGHNSFGDFGYKATRIDHYETVITKTIDNLIKGLKLSRVDLIKIDVEGSELSVLKGSISTLKTLRPLILIEISDKLLKTQNTTSQEVISFVSSFAYKIFAFDHNSGRLRSERKKKSYKEENLLAVPKEKQEFLKAI